MKTKELIKLLQKEDPSGEAECCVGNADVYYIESLPAYYDGCQQVLVRDPNNKYYNVIGAKFISQGTKIDIRTLSISDAIFNNVDLPIEYDADYSKRHYEKWVEEQRKQAIDIKNDVERGTFTEYCKKRFAKEDEMFDYTEIEPAAIKFYDENMTYKDAMPEELKNKKKKDKKGNTYYPSWRDRRFEQWDSEITMEVIDGKISFKKEKKPEIVKSKNIRSTLSEEYAIASGFIALLCFCIFATTGNLILLIPTVISAILSFLQFRYIYNQSTNRKNLVNQD